MLRAAVAPPKETMVHKGFLASYDSLRHQVFRLVDAITAPKGGAAAAGAPGTEWRVFITGHSLGGALATLCAYELAKRGGAARQCQQLTLYTFGAPRVGNKVFADEYNR